MAWEVLVASWGDKITSGGQWGIDKPSCIQFKYERLGNFCYHRGFMGPIRETLDVKKVHKIGLRMRSESSRISCFETNRS